MPAKPQNLSPFAKWLEQLTEERDTTLTAIARKSGLATGTLRYLLLEPDRKPSLETCLRLSAFSGRPVDELLALANQRSSQPVDPYNPDRLKMMSIFDALPVAGRRVLLGVAELIVELTEGRESNRDKE